MIRTCQQCAQSLIIRYNPLQMNDSTVIGIDCSTTSIKAIAWNRDGRCVDQDRCSYETLNPKPSWYEQSAEDWWTGLCSCLRSLTRRLHGHGIEAICITNQRESFVPVDAQCRPLRNAILWNDERSLPQLSLLEERIGAKRLHRITGKPLSMTPALPKMVWLQENEPEIVEKTRKFLDPHAFLVHRLTGILGTSLACADPQGLIDMARGSWSEEIITTMGFRVDQFPRLYAPGEAIGPVNKEAAAATGLPVGLTVVAGAGDGQCAGLGVDATSGKQAYLNLGTAVVAGVLSDTYLTDLAFRTLCAPLSGSYYLETVLKGGVFTVSWFAERFAPDLKGHASGRTSEQLLEEEAARVPPGSLGLLLVPYWHNAMSPYWDPAASGITIGWTGAHGRAHFYRAILEGVAFEQRLMGDGVMRTLGRPIEEYLALGGGSRSDLWCQILADITGIPIQRTAALDATCLGAGILATPAVGWYPDLAAAAKAMVKTERRFKPQPEYQGIYDRLYTEVYRPLFPTLKSLIDRLADLTNPFK
jgi:sugar (pentulose or hexulose) kinase